MGCGPSAFDLRYDAASEPLDRIYEKLDVSRKEGKKFFKYFEKIDDDHGGSIQLDEFFQFFDLEWSSFAKRAFKAMDFEQDGESSNALDFSEFFVGLWNYCTMDHGFLVKFAFDLFDDDGSGSIEIAEVKALAEMVYGKKGLDAKVKKIIKNLDDDGSGEISLQEFREAEKKHRSMLFPAFDLQRKLRRAVMTERYWMQATRRRKQKTGKDDIIELHYFLTNGKRLNRQEEREKGPNNKEGSIKAIEGAVCHVYRMPDKDAQRFPGKKEGEFEEIPAGTKVTVFEERPDADDASKLWFLVSANEARWILSEFLKIDATWLKYEAQQAQKKAQREAEIAAKKKLREDFAKDKAALMAMWKETKDPKTGRKYWYNINSSSTTWNDPFKELNKKYKKLNEDLGVISAGDTKA